MENVPGTTGYERVVDKFIEVSQSLPFEDVNKVFLEFLPAAPCRVLDAGAGAGQNAASMARLGHSVVAIEPLSAFLEAARRSYADLNITWIDDCLPLLKKLDETTAQFEFILIQGVWHHLDEWERRSAIQRLAVLLDDGGTCAISLRNGPAAAGTHVFPTDGTQTIRLAADRVTSRQPAVVHGKQAGCCLDVSSREERTVERQLLAYSVEKRALTLAVDHFRLMCRSRS